MTWIQTYSGLAVDILDVRPMQIALIDIAHSLSRLCRYTGHSRDHTSVAEHCCRGADLLLRNCNEAAAWRFLTHDAGESVTGDISRPLKLAMREIASRRGSDESDFDVVESLVALAINSKLDPGGTGYLWDSVVKVVDLRDLVTESRAQFGPPPRPWTDTQEPHDVPIQCWDASRARREWLNRAATLAPTRGLRDEALAALGTLVEDTEGLAAEVERLRGLVEGARFFLGEDMPSTAYLLLCGMGLEDGIDPTLEHTAVGKALIEEGCDERDVIEAARALVATMTTDTLPDNGTRWQEARALREALAKLGDPR